MMTLKTLKALETPKSLALARDTPLSVIPSYLSRAIGAAKAVLGIWTPGTAVRAFFAAPTICYNSYHAAEAELREELKKEHAGPWWWSPYSDYMSPEADRRWARRAAKMAIAAAGECLRREMVGALPGDSPAWVPGFETAKESIRAARFARHPKLRAAAVAASRR